MIFADNKLVPFYLPYKSYAEILRQQTALFFCYRFKIYNTAAIYNGYCVVDIKAVLFFNPIGLNGYYIYHQSDVFSTVHRSIELFHLPTLMHNSLFINNMYVTLQSSTCFEHQHAHLQKDKLYYHSILYRHSL